MGILANDVLAEQSVDEAHDPDNADEHLVQHGELVAVLSTVLTLRPRAKIESSRKISVLMTHEGLC